MNINSESQRDHEVEAKTYFKILIWVKTNLHKE